MISFERSEKEIKEKKEPSFPSSHSFPFSHLPFSTDSDSKTINSSTRQLYKFQCTKRKNEFYSYICSCFMSSDCQIHFTRATDFFKITQQHWSWRSIWRLNGSEDKTYHRGGQNDSRGQTCFIIT